jgi:lysylphosphatidylglycerol synthetase-like protein (DUF2156 family)
MLRRFFAAARRPVLCYVDEPTIEDLGALGPELKAAPMGIDLELDLPRLLAEPPREVRSASRKAEKAGLRVVPLRGSPSAALRHEIGQVTRAYLARSQVPVEMTFLNRPMTLEKGDMRRVFLLEMAGPESHDLLGYAVLNPWFEAGEPRGYLLDIVRFRPTRIWGLYLATVRALASRLHAEGHELSLGFTPLYHLRSAPAARSRVLEAQMRWMSRSCAEVKYVKRLRAMKSLFPGHETPRFFACTSRAALVPFAAFMRATGVSLRTFLGPDTFRAIRRARRGPDDAKAGERTRACA